MMTGSISRRLLRFAGVLALAAFTVSCASPQHGPTVSPSGYGGDPVSRAERLVGYCDRLASKGELVTAVGLCARAHEINPDAPEPLMKIAGLLQMLDHKEAATQTYGTLLQRHPGHHEARYSLGKLYMEIGKSDLAALHFNHAIRGNPTDPRSYNALGVVRDQAGEHEAAQVLYRAALGHDPDNFSVRNNLGLSLAMNGQREEAIEILAELSIDPLADQTVMRNLEAAYASHSLAAPEQAEIDQQNAISTEPELPAASPVLPVRTEHLEPPGKGASIVTPAPSEPSHEAPTPLFVPRPSTAGEPEQSGALEAGPASVIQEAARQLMAAPDWADFEPGTLIDTRLPPEASISTEQAPQDLETSVVKLDTTETQPVGYALSMLMIGGQPSFA